jgi:hypothetical protein
MTITSRRIWCMTKQWATAACFAAIGGVSAWSAQPDDVLLHNLPALVVPGYGPGIGGQISEGPSTPVCQANTACIRPFSDAIVLILDPTNRFTIGSAVTNTSGSFLLSVGPGTYIVHVKVVDFPRCPEAQATIGQRDFTLVQITCDTGIR